MSGPIAPGSSTKEVNNGTATSKVRQRIVAAARAEFFAHGFRNVTMEDLARRLAMSKKTVYAHFSSKTALLEAMLLDKFADLDHDLTAVTSASGGFHSVLANLLACVQKHTAEIQPAFVRDVQREAPELFEFIETRRRALIQSHFQRVLDKGRTARRIRKDIPLEVMVEILLAATRAIVNPDKVLELGLTPQTAFHAVLSVVLEGVLTRPGRPKP